MTSLQTIRELIQGLTWLEMETLVQSFNDHMWPHLEDDDLHLMTGKMLNAWAGTVEFAEDDE